LQKIHKGTLFDNNCKPRGAWVEPNGKFAVGSWDTLKKEPERADTVVAGLIQVKTQEISPDKG